MRTSPLLELLNSADSTAAPYRGSLSWEGDAALEGERRLYDCSWRAVIRAQGPDARTWLNGMITANVKNLTPGQTLPSFQLDPKGHILAVFEVGCIGTDAFLLLTDETQREGLLQRLRRFVFISKVTLEDESEACGALRLRGAGAEEAGDAAGLGQRTGVGQIEEIEIGDDGKGWRIEERPGGTEQIEILMPAAAVTDVWARLGSIAKPAGWAAQERDRILSRVPLYGSDITETELPQETGQTAALNFEKGCYVGQEIVERIRARGAVHKHFRAFGFREEVRAGTRLREQAEGGGEIGRITSATRDTEGGWLALGYVRDPRAGAGSTVFADGAEGQVMA